MMRNWQTWFDRVPLRLRLTGWYILLLGLTLLLFSGYLYFQLEREEFAQSKATLEIEPVLKAVASQLIEEVDGRSDRPFFERTNNFSAASDRFKEKSLAARLISANGEVWDGYGNYQMAPIWIPKAPGYAYLPDDETIWYIYSQPVGKNWLQVMQSFKSSYEVAEELVKHIFLSLPMVLFLTGLGGLFLSDRALRPIDRVTRIAQNISASDLTERINYRGATDEVGRLAKTFDRMLDRLQAAFERERQFVADASHELRTPLTAIKGQIGVALSRSRPLLEYEKILKNLEKEVDRLIRLANALLFLARFDRNQIHCHLEKVELSNLLLAIVEQVSPLAELQQVVLTENIASGLYVTGDSDYLIRLFLNLLDNAIKYTPPAGRVSISAKQQGTSKVQIAISDTGIGISPEHLTRLCQRFYRVEADRSGHTGGAGLGLAIADEIVRLHGGHLKVESKLNKGSTFTVDLPTGK
jgi:heavy metal sensor kinase